MCDLCVISDSNYNIQTFFAPNAKNFRQVDQNKQTSDAMYAKTYVDLQTCQNVFGTEKIITLVRSVHPVRNTSMNENPQKWDFPCASLTFICDIIINTNQQTLSRLWNGITGVDCSRLIDVIRQSAAVSNSHTDSRTTPNSRLQQPNTCIYYSALMQVRYLADRYKPTQSLNGIISRHPMKYVLLHVFNSFIQPSIIFFHNPGFVWTLDKGRQL